MKYFEVDFTISPYSADASDVLAAMAGEAGFETFEETETGLKGYVQQSLFDVSVLKTALEDFPFEDTTISYDIREAEDRDWNEQWEQEGFEPIVISENLIIHDGRHLPDSTPDIAIEIDAKLAFGTGTHEWNCNQKAEFSIVVQARVSFPSVLSNWVHRRLSAMISMSGR